MIRRAFCILLLGLTLGACNSDESDFRDPAVGGPLSAPSATGRWSGELDGQPVSLVLKQDGTRVTGWGVRARNGLTDYVYVAGYADPQSNGQVQLLHSDSEDDFDNEQMWFALSGGRMTAAMLGGPGPNEQTFQLTGSSPLAKSAELLPGGSYQLEATGLDRDGNTVNFKIRLTLGADGQHGSWSLVSGESLLVGAEGSLEALVSPRLGMAALTFFDNGGVNQGNLLFPVAGLPSGSPAALLANSSKLITQRGPIYVSGTVTLQHAGALPAEPPPAAAGLPKLEGRYASDFDTPDRGLELFLRQQNETIQGEGFLRTSVAPPRHLRVTGQVAAGGQAILHLAPDSPLDGDELTVVVRLQEGVWGGELLDSQQALVHSLALVHPHAPNALGKLWDNQLVPLEGFTPNEVYRFQSKRDFTPRTFTLDVTLTHVGATDDDAYAVGKWQATGDIPYKIGDVLAVNLEHSPETSYLLLSLDEVRDLKYWMAFPRFQNGQAGEQAETYVSLGQSYISIGPGDTRPNFTPELVFGNVTLLQP